MEQEKHCSGKSYGDEENKQIGLTHYYNNFIDGSCDVISQCVNSETEPISNLKDFSNKKIIVGKNIKTCNDISLKPTIWKCSYNCGKIFTQEKHMKNHILVMHENTNLVQCKVCFKYLSTKARLKSHMLRHSGVQHLVCLVCVDERANDLSCIRHHLLEKHGIGSKHSLFHDSYYEMSLKEMSLIKMSKTRQLIIKDCKEWKVPADKYRKSATHLDELKWKLMERSNRVKGLLNMMQEADDMGLKQKMELQEEEEVSHPDSLMMKVGKTKLQKIVTAENGMKLVKLSNGQFRKFTWN